MVLIVLIMIMKVIIFIIALKWDATIRVLVEAEGSIKNVAAPKITVRRSGNFSFIHVVQSSFQDRPGGQILRQ